MPHCGNSMADASAAFAGSVATISNRSVTRSPVVVLERWALPPSKHDSSASTPIRHLSFPPDSKSCSWQQVCSLASERKISVSHAFSSMRGGTAGLGAGGLSVLLLRVGQKVGVA
jgi:hypothetical protein